MPGFSLPNNIQNEDDLDADKVMANFQTLTAGLNGNIGTDNAIIDSPVSQPGAAASAGVSSAFLRADVLFAIQGFETVPALPTTGNFLYRRCVVNAGVNIGKGFICTDPSGSGTWIVVENPAATDLVIHAAQHLDGQHDPMPDNFLTDHMKALRTIYSATISADVNAISTSSYTTLVDLSVTTNGIQTLHVTIHNKATNTSGANKPRVAYRVVDQTAGGTPTIFVSEAHQLGVSGGGSDTAGLCYSFFYTVPASGARTLRLQAGCDLATVNIIKQTTFNGETLVPVNISAVVV